MKINFPADDFTAYNPDFSNEIKFLRVSMQSNYLEEKYGDKKVFVIRGDFFLQMRKFFIAANNFYSNWLAYRESIPVGYMEVDRITLFKTFDKSLKEAYITGTDNCIMGRHTVFVPSKLAEKESISEETDILVKIPTPRSSAKYL